MSGSFVDHTEPAAASGVGPPSSGDAGQGCPCCVQERSTVVSTDLATSADVRRLARPTVLAIEPYAWESSNLEIAARFGLRPEDVIRFDTNTSPLPPPCLSAVLRTVQAEPQVNEYFDSSYTALVEALCEYTSASPENLVIGAGADEILDIIAKTFLDPGDIVVVPTPTYAMYRIVSQFLGAKVRHVPPRLDLSFDIDAVIAAAAGAKLIFLCNPNNPTGMRLPSVEIERLVRAVECMVVVDEAYAEFSGDSVVPLVTTFPRLIVVRTLSKAFSLAGARVGYLVAATEVVNLANRVRPPNSVSYISAALGEAAARDQASMRANVASLIAERNWLSDELTQLGVEPVPSSTNFVLVKLPSPSVAARVHASCLRQGLVLRSYESNQALRSYLRITARLREHDQRLVNTLEQDF